MEFLVFGLNHKTAPIQIRERLALAPAEQSHLNQVIGTLKCDSHILLSTCNRVELYISMNTAVSSILTAQDLIRIFAEIGQVNSRELTPHIYYYRGDEAVKHLFRVAASLDSMVVGEPQILGQLKNDTLQSRAKLPPRTPGKITGNPKEIVCIHPCLEGTACGARDLGAAW